MLELSHRSIREQLGAADPAAIGPDIVVRVADVAAQFYVASTLAPNTRAGGDPYTLWLSPDRALRVGGAMPEGFASDIDDGLAVFDITGPRSAEIVAMGCTLGAAELAPGRCAQTIFAGVKVVLYSHGEGFRLHVERQLAAFMLTWLQVATTALDEGEAR